MRAMPEAAFEQDAVRDAPKEPSLTLLMSARER
jgi:hypothetical protein